MEMEDLSSTAIRKRYIMILLIMWHLVIMRLPLVISALRLAASESVEDLTGPAVSEYLFKNELHKLFAK
jgi:hypothetical protein